MFLSMLLIEDVCDLHPLRFQEIGYHGPVAPPVNSLSAHYGHRSLVSQLNEFLNSFAEGGRFHVIRIIPERLVRPAGVLRLLSEPFPSAAQFLQPNIADIKLSEFSPNYFSVELGILERTGKTSHVR